MTLERVTDALGGGATGRAQAPARSFGWLEKRLCATAYSSRERGCGWGDAIPRPRPGTLRGEIQLWALIRVPPLSHGIRPTPANTVDQTTDLIGVIIRLWFVHEELRLQGHRG